MADCYGGSEDAANKNSTTPSSQKNMQDTCLEESHLILVKWKPKDISESNLKNFIYAKCKTEVTIHFGRIKYTALLEFDEKSKQNINFIRSHWNDESVWTIVDVTGIPPTLSVRVTNLPAAVKREDIYKYFTNNVNTNKQRFEPEISVDQYNSVEGWCIMDLPSKQDVKTICDSYKRFKQFRDKTLEIKRYYQQIDDFLNKTVIIKGEKLIKGIDHRKYHFLKEYIKKDIEIYTQQNLCAKLHWGKDEEMVKLTFSCPHQPVHMIEADWSELAERGFLDQLDTIRVIEKKCDQTIWQAVCDIQTDFDGFHVEQNSETFCLTIVGHDSKSLSEFKNRIDSIQPPPKVITKVIEVKDVYKLIAFEQFELTRKMKADFDITISVVKTKLQLDITGTEECVKKADKAIIAALLTIYVHRYEIKKEEIANILNTKMMADEIEILMKNYDNCFAIMDKKVLIVLCIGEIKTVPIYEAVLGLVKEEKVRLQGEIQSRTEIEQKITEVTKLYRALLHLTYTEEKKKSEVVCCFTCPKEYVDLVYQEILTKVGTRLVKQERILVAPFFVKQILQNKYFEPLKKDMESEKLEQKCLITDEKTHTLCVYGNAVVRENVKKIVKRYTDKINVSWMRVEEDGIDIYYDHSENNDDLKDSQKKHKCTIRIATKNDMKEKNIHCIALLETGQAIFTGTGDVTNLSLPVDVLVNAANRELNHRGGLAKAISKAGGKAIQNECSAFIHKHGKLMDGDVFTSTAGELNYLKIVHAVGPVWKQGDTNQLLANVIINVLEAVVKEDNCVLRSVAIPLISSGTFSVPRNTAAMIMIETLKTKLPEFKSVREVFLFDLNSAVVRVIQGQMEKSFGESCYHLPIENIVIGKGTMTQKTTGRCKIERKGTRTLPLPGNKKIIIVWGQLEETTADVLVNTTIAAPKPSGGINQALHKAAGVVYDLNRQIEAAFTVKVGIGPVPDGTLVPTKSGNIPSNGIYHVKISSWDETSGEKNICDYTRTCLQEAVRTKVKSIAFPTIGTHDFNYNHAKVARAMVRTVGEFMRLHSNSSLEVIKIVIFKKDIVCTSAFEDMIETMYCQRPHRLEAIIEETNEMLSDEEDTVDTGNVHLNQDPKPQGGQKTFKVNQQFKLVLEQGYIQKITADVIVCTTSSFPKLFGAIANAITKDGGAEIEKYCMNKYKKYPDVGIATAPGGRLQCKKIYFLKLEEFKTQADGQKIYNYVKACLEKADTEKVASIAFPTIGTGGFKFPDILAATKTYEAIRDFSKRQKTSLDTVSIIMFPQANMSIQTFNAEVDTYFGAYAGQPSQQQPSAEVGKVPIKLTEDDCWSVPNTKTTVELSFGNLEKSQADVILNTTTSFPNLNGVISSSLIRVAGSELQKECLAYQHKVTVGDIVETKGYGLNCKKVLHFVIPPWNNSGKQKMIQDKMVDFLHLMKKSGLHSIALPSIGTGGYQYDANMVANGLYDAIKIFGDTSPDYTCLVRIVLFPAAKDVNKVFTDQLGGKRSSKKPTKGVHFFDDDGNDERGGNKEVKARNMKDFVLFQIVSDDPKKEKAAFSDIKMKINDDRKTASINLSKDTTFDDMKILDQEANKKKILDIGEGFTTKIVIDLPQKKIHLSGMGENINRCHNKILEEIRELRSIEQQKKVGNVVHKYLEWYYTEDDSKLWVPYPRRIAYILEDAYKQNENTKEFKDSDGKYYIVDFQKMKENVKDSKDSKTSVEVIRKDLSIGDFGMLPAVWDPMDQTENLREVELKPTDQEYQNVETEFKNTLKGFRLNTIGKIKRIQNVVLYQQYALRKKQLETGLKGVADIERTLWHGIKEHAEAFITSNGFDRGHAGQTFAGKVWYGQGTYFAVNSEYSAGDTYSPAAIDGYKRMYMVKVLTGRTVPLAKGVYNERFPPLIPGSTTDRYNSVCNDIKNPEEFVIFSDTQAYPEYMIYFQ